MNTFDVTTNQEISNLAQSIEEHATILRGQLEELAEIISRLENDYYFSPNGEILESYDLQDFADDVSKVEETFFNE